MKKCTATLCFVLLLLLVFTAAGWVFAQDFYVQQTAGRDANPGDGWGEGHALATLQKAIELARTTSEKDTVHVAAATYNENVELYDSMTLYGGYPSSGGTVRDPLTNRTTIDGGHADTVVSIDSAVDVVLDGFVIQNGEVVGVGGGIAITGSRSVTVQNNVVTQNTARNDWGGGIAVLNSHVAIAGNTIQNNQCIGDNGRGGGISFWDNCSGTVTGNTITGNSASEDGGGMMIDNADLSIVSNYIDSNTAAGGSGGGIYIVDADSIAIIGNTITNNTITGTNYPRGAGVLCTGSNVQIRRNFIQNNTGANWGGGINIYNSTGGIVNNLIAGNQAALNGGGIIFAQVSSGEMSSNTIVGNSAGAGGGVYVESTSDATANNTIVWGNASGEVDGNGAFTATYCTIKGGYPGTGNLVSNPLFAGGDDYQLTSNSSCIDSGISMDVPETDILGISRPQGQGYDRGAYEYVGVPVPDIKANGQDGPITVSAGQPVAIAIGLDCDNLSGKNADWWIVELTPEGVFYYLDLSAGTMIQGLLPTYQGPLFTFPATPLLQFSSLTVGTHIFGFAVDTVMNGSLDADTLYFDAVVVTISE